MKDGDMILLNGMHSIPMEVEDHQLVLVTQEDFQKASGLKGFEVDCYVQWQGEGGMWCDCSQQGWYPTLDKTSSKWHPTLDEIPTEAKGVIVNLFKFVLALENNSNVCARMIEED